MKFSIITPTYKRPDKLRRAINSVLSQSHQNWEMIIVNDSPDDASYSKIADALNDKRIKYSTNKTNLGVNYSRNRALGTVASDSDWIIFLDDDDFFTSKALEAYSALIGENADRRWIVTNRAYPDGTPITKAPRDNASYSYACDYLIRKTIKNDATHCIRTEAVKGIRFPAEIKQGEEWLFFFQIGRHNDLFYRNIDTTFSDGYDAAAGLNFRKRTKTDQWQTLILIIREGGKKNLLFSPYFLAYICMRFVRILIK